MTVIKVIDILLINPFSWTRDGRPPYLPYGILYLASFLRKRGVKVAIHDCNTNDNWLHKVNTLKPKFVGLSVLTGSVIKEALEITHVLKDDYPDVKIVWGGLHPTLFPEICRKEADYIIQGEGEVALYELVKHGKEPNGKERLCNLDENPLPAYDLIDLEDYIQDRGWATRVLTLNTSRGCVFKCSFCQNQGLPERKWRGLSAVNIYKQIKYLIKHANINGVFFYEDNFDADKKRVMEFCHLFRGDIKFGHSSNIPLCNEETLKVEVKAGLAYIDYGVESGSDRILKLLNKKQSVAQVIRAYSICKKLGLRTGALFMLGLPTETELELKQTIRLIDRIKPDIPICTIYRPYPKTPLYELMKINAPETLEEQADYYNYGEWDTEIENVSEVSTKRLLQVQRYFLNQALTRELYKRKFDFKWLWTNVKRKLTID